MLISFLIKQESINDIIPPYNQDDLHAAIKKVIEAARLNILFYRLLKLNSV